MRHDWDPNDQQNWEMNCEAERAAKVRPLRDYNGDILNTGDLVWLTNRIDQWSWLLFLASLTGRTLWFAYIKGGYRLHSL
jgi:hypothetical protein